MMLVVPASGAAEGRKVADAASRLVASLTAGDRVVKAHGAGCVEGAIGERSISRGYDVEARERQVAARRLLGVLDKLGAVALGVEERDLDLVQADGPVVADSNEVVRGVLGLHPHAYQQRIHRVILEDAHAQVEVDLLDAGHDVALGDAVRVGRCVSGRETRVGHVVEGLEAQERVGHRVAPAVYELNTYRDALREAHRGLVLSEQDELGLARRVVRLVGARVGVGCTGVGTRVGVVVDGVDGVIAASGERRHQ